MPKLLFPPRRPAGRAALAGALMMVAAAAVVVSVSPSHVGAQPKGGKAGKSPSPSPPLSRTVTPPRPMTPPPPGGNPLMPAAGLYRPAGNPAVAGIQRASPPASGITPAKRVVPESKLNPGRPVSVADLRQNVADRRARVANNPLNAALPPSVQRTEAVLSRGAGNAVPIYDRLPPLPPGSGGGATTPLQTVRLNSSGNILAISGSSSSSGTGSNLSMSQAQQVPPPPPGGGSSGQYMKLTLRPPSTGYSTLPASAFLPPSGASGSGGAGSPSAMVSSQPAQPIYFRPPAAPTSPGRFSVEASSSPTSQYQRLSQISPTGLAAIQRDMARTSSQTSIRDIPKN